MDCVEFQSTGGFKLQLDMCLYSKKAVLKVLNRWSNQYTIALYSAPQNTLIVEMEPMSVVNVESECDSKKILNAIVLEMLRLDVITQTSNIRELLVGRALYATCIEVDKASGDTQAVTLMQNWQEDSRRILVSWSNEG